MQYGDFVSLRSSQGKYLVAELNGSVNANQSSIDPSAKWKLLNPSNINSRNPIDDGDEIILRSYHSKYLSAEEGNLTANSSKAGSSEKWKMVKAP